MVAENEAGKDETQCNVSVTSLPSIDEKAYINPEAFKYLEQPYTPTPELKELKELKPPKVIIPLTDEKLIEGQTILLACKIEGIPKPKV